MQLTSQAILNNLVSVQSDELMQQHLSDPQFSAVWNTFTICRMISFSAMGPKLLPLLDHLANIRNGQVAYRVLMTACKMIRLRNELTVPSPYRPSPFTT